jgi:hypothetical protein
MFTSACPAFAALPGEKKTADNGLTKMNYPTPLPLFYSPYIRFM